MVGNKIRHLKCFIPEYEAFCVCFTWDLMHKEISVTSRMFYFMVPGVPYPRNIGYTGVSQTWLKMVVTEIVKCMHMYMYENAIMALLVFRACPKNWR